MEGRFGLVLAVLLASSMGLAGCIEALESFSSSDEVNITAKEHRDLADGAAAAWHPQAFLVGATSLETLDPRAGVPFDDTVGDGRAPFWYYGYGAPDTTEVRLFRADSDGRVTTEEKLPGILALMDFPSYAVGQWDLDSDAAVAAAMGTEEFSTVFADGNVTLVEGLGSANETGTKWLVAAYTDRAVVVALVDPVTGEVEIQDFAMPETAMPAVPPMPTFAPLTPPVVIHDEGTLGGTTREKTYDFTATEGMSGYFQVEMATSEPMQSFAWELLLDGDYVSGGRLGSGLFGGEASTVWDIEIDEPGDYSLVIYKAGPTDWSPIDSPVDMGGMDFVFDFVVGFDVEMPEDAEEDS